MKVEGFGLTRGKTTNALGLTMATNQKKIKMSIIAKRRTRGVLLPKYWQILGFVRAAMRFHKEASSRCIHR